MNKKNKVIGLSIVGGIILTGVTGNAVMKVKNQTNTQFILNEMSEIEEILGLKLQDNENLRKLAFFIQKSEIKDDGAIRNPRYFMSLPSEYRYAIIRVKDYEKCAELFDYCLHTKISDDEKARFEKELPIKNIQINQKTR